MVIYTSCIVDKGRFYEILVTFVRTFAVPVLMVGENSKVYYGDDMGFVIRSVLLLRLALTTDTKKNKP